MMGGIKKSVLVFSLYFICLPIGYMCLSGKLPSTNKNLFMKQHSFILPNGKEASIYLLKDIPKRYYFSLEESNAHHFSVTVTPCDVPIEWSILHYRKSHILYGIKSAYQALDDVKSRPFYKAVSTLYHYKGNSVENYVGISLYSSSLFSLEFLSTERDTHISVYLTTDLTYGNLFPELPGDPRVDITTINHNSVTLVWKPSPSALKIRENIEYCILVNEKHNYKSLCAADAAVQSISDRWSKFSTPVSKYTEDYQQGLYFSNREFSITHQNKYEYVRQICIGNKNVYEVSNLTSNTQYYFDVFAINLFTNASVAYTGTFVKTLTEPRPKYTQLKDGKIAHVTLNGKAQRNHTFQYQAKHKKVQLTFQPCKGKVKVQILKNGKTLVSELIHSLRHITLSGEMLGNYLVITSSEQSTNSSLMVQASSHIYIPLFQFFPDSLKLRSFNKLRTCNSITIAWLGTKERSLYCVYKKKIQEDQIWKEMSNGDRCIGPDLRPKSEKVSCKFFNNINLQKAVTTETISGLEKETSYLIDVYLMGSPGIFLRYNTKVVKTRKNC